MAKRLEEYVKYTKTELDSYVQTNGSCVQMINSNRHYALDPYVLSELKSALPAYILKHEISYYEAKLQGVLLAVKNIKVLNGVAALRADDPHLHIDINADCYVFRPEEGAELTGVIKHIGKHHVSVVLYRVFNANIIFKERLDKGQLAVGQDLKFRVRSFCLNGTFININGELLTSPVYEEDEASTTKKAKKVVFEDDEHENGTPDSGIEEENKVVELDELLNSIKNEPLSDDDFAGTSKQKLKPTKRKQKMTESSIDAPEILVNNNQDLSGNEKKRKRKPSAESVASVNVKNEFAKKIKKEKQD